MPKRHLTKIQGGGKLANFFLETICLILGMKLNESFFSKGNPDSHSDDYSNCPTPEIISAKCSKI